MSKTKIGRCRTSAIAATMTLYCSTFLSAAPCTVDDAQLEARKIFLTTSMTDIVAAQKDAGELATISAKAKGSGAVGPQLSPADRARFAELTQNVVAYRLRTIVAADRQRDIGALVQMATIAESNHLRSQYITDLTKAPDAYLQGLLSGLESRQAHDRALPVPARSDGCSLDQALVNEERRAQTLIKTPQSETNDDPQSYFRALEWLRRLNAASLHLVELDSADISEASASQDATKVFRTSLGKAAAEGKISDDEMWLTLVLRALNAAMPAPDLKDQATSAK